MDDDLKRAIATPAGLATIASKGTWDPYLHLEIMAAFIADVAATPNGRGVLSVPPGRGKSYLTSLWTPVWWLTGRPMDDVALFGYGQAFSNIWGRRVRDTGRETGLIPIRRDMTATKDWQTRMGGGMLCGSVGGGMAIGRHFNLLIIDDPYKGWVEAQQYKTREGVQNWFDGTLYNRKRPGCSIIVVHTRWHRHDLIGYLKEHPDKGGHPDDWRELKIPAEALADNDILGRQIGEPLPAPGETIEEAAADFKTVKNKPRIWNAVYQQDPMLGAHGRCYHQYGDHNTAAGATPRKGIPLRISFDWNIDPGMHATISQFLPATKELIYWGQVHGPAMTVIQCVESAVEMVNRRCGGFEQFTEVHVLGDATGVQRSVQTNLKSTVVAINGLRTHEDVKIPVRNRIPGHNPGVSGSVEATNAALGAPGEKISVFFHPDWCNDVREDMKETPADKEGNPDKGDNARSHYSDCVRYDVWDCMPLRFKKRSADEVSPEAPQ